MSIIRMGTGNPIVPSRVAGPYAYGHSIEQVLGVRATSTSNNALVFKRGDLEQPFLTQNNSMWHYLEPEFKRQLASITDDRSFIQSMRQTLYRAIAAGGLFIDTIASRLGVSVRTLQRYLANGQTTFKVETQLVQQKMAIEFAKNPQLTTTEIAYLVGYTEVSSFTRAFKRWTGQTLTQYRG
ncbi:helix-turn-helix domain-containing protein [Lactiplantibacillus mudanjiangensis]|uniref:helix-turn-helix domain-containing protein n=1 Tax=Lactiplantibacillus mudanjiangensis TaxID=1296538 RepID=UPI0010300CFA|nr:AraC family transcriptional regulator [Lactiplantibacillus mudanjiangensis]